MILVHFFTICLIVGGKVGGNLISISIVSMSAARLLTHVEARVTVFFMCFSAHLGFLHAGDCVGETAFIHRLKGMHNLLLSEKKLLFQVNLPMTSSFAATSWLVVFSIYFNLLKQALQIVSKLRCAFNVTSFLVAS